MKEFISGLVSTDDSKIFKRIYRQRKRKYTYLSVRKGTERPYLDQDGYEIDREYKTRTSLRKAKPEDEIFEDEVWCALAGMGFTDMNEDRKCKIQLSKNQNVNPKQIDVYAKEDDVALVIECKSALKTKKKTFRTEISAFDSIRSKITSSIRKHHDNGSLAVRMIFATKNIIWSDADLEMAKDHNIHVLRDKELNYFTEMAKYLGTYARYQLFADIFENTAVRGLTTRVPAIRAKMGKTKYYSFSIEPSKLLKIAYVSHRSKGTEGSDISYQRMVNKTRLNKIRKYVNETGGLFPNSIIINVRNKKAMRFEKKDSTIESNMKFGWLYLPPKYKSAWIIDGQHRLYGFTDTEFADKVTIPVIAFENLHPSREGQLFIDINSKQTKVTPNLLHALYADLLWDSENKGEQIHALRSRIVQTLGSDLDSPLLDKIKLSDSRSKNPLTMYTLSDSLKHNNLVGEATKNDGIKPGPLWCYGRSDKDSTLKRSVKILKHYFSIFSDKVYSNWQLGNEPGGYLCTNNGIAALLIVLKRLSNKIAQDEQADSSCNVDETIFCELLERYTEPLCEFFAHASAEEILNYRRQLGKGGQSNAAFGMMHIIHQQFNDFRPKGLEEYIEDNKSEHNEKARDLVPDLQMKIRRTILPVLKRVYGKDYDDWWYGGIPEQVRTNAASRKEKQGDKRTADKMFNLLDYKTIIESSREPKNWPLFQPIFAFKKYGTSKSNQVSWFLSLNEIRKKVAHPERGQVTKKEMQFLEGLEADLEERFEEHRQST